MNSGDEEFVPEEEAEEGPAALKRLREKLKKAVAEKQEYLEGWQRARADFANYKKEEASLHTDKEARVRAELAESIIPALDTFEMAFGTKWYEGAHQEWKGGVMSIYRELVRSLERFGVKIFNPLGEPFDPQKHEAIRQVPVDKEEQDHTVVSVQRSGYSVGDTIIRPAQVTIGNFEK
ncbi:MAG: nucleotide exchange factor GrpE, partial [Patescibacteria group bacterium]|nr:nucleotide exchange factor GrpE [Patescibacteria group bacterium]